MRYKLIQNGFTLLELLIVVLILAVLAGMTLSTFTPHFLDEKKETAVLYEMKQIRDAIRRFKQDNPGFPFADTNLCTPADASFLFEQDFDNDNDCERGEATDGSDRFSDWDTDYQLGWRGPYLSTNGSQYVDMGDDLDHTGNGSPLSGTLKKDIMAIADAFVYEPVVQSNVRYLQWRSVSGDADSNFFEHGRPYLFFDLGDMEKARIVSMGEDGVYDGVGSDPCEPAGDDYVLCLY